MNFKSLNFLVSFFGGHFTNKSFAPKWKKDQESQSSIKTTLWLCQIPKNLAIWDSIFCSRNALELDVVPPMHSLDYKIEFVVAKFYSNFMKNFIV